MATLMVTGVDSRVKAGVPLSACGRRDVAVESPTAWQHALLTAAGLDTTSPQWETLLVHLDPAKLAAQATGALWLANGTSDEFFPLTAHVKTLLGLPAGTWRTSLSANYDHGCYALAGGESAGDIEERAALRAKGAQRAWLKHHLRGEAPFQSLPQPPVVEVTPAGAAVIVSAVVEGGGAGWDVEDVRFWWSGDKAFLWGDVELDGSGGGIYQKLIPVTQTPDTITFVDVEYRGKLPYLLERFSLSSLPAIPDGLVPHIRAQDTCL